MSSSATQPMSDSPSNRMGRDSISKSNGLALDRRDSESDEGKQNEILIQIFFCNVFANSTQYWMWNTFLFYRKTIIKTSRKR